MGERADKYDSLAKRWADACIAHAENYQAGVRAAQAKYAQRLRERDGDAIARQLDEIRALPETVERGPQGLTG